MLILDIFVLAKLIICVRYFIRYKRLKLAIEEHRNLSLKQRLSFALIYVLGSLSVFCTILDCADPLLALYAPDDFGRIFSLYTNYAVIISLDFLVSLGILYLFDIIGRKQISYD